MIKSETWRLLIPAFLFKYRHLSANISIYLQFSGNKGDGKVMGSVSNFHFEKDGNRRQKRSSGKNNRQKEINIGMSIRFDQSHLQESKQVEIEDIY